MRIYISLTKAVCPEVDNAKTFVDFEWFYFESNITMHWFWKNWGKKLDLTKPVYSTQPKSP